MFMVSLIMVGVGAGLSGILLANFTVIYDEPKSIQTYQKEITMHDNLYLGYRGIYFDYLIADRDDVYIEVDYHNDFGDADVKIQDNLIVEEMATMVNFRDISKNILDDLRHNIIRKYDDRGIIDVRISANQGNISTMLRNLSKHYKIDIQEIEDGYRIYIVRPIEDSSHCTLNRNNLYDCIEVMKDFRCSYEIVDGRVIPDDNCQCTSLESDRYYCRYGA